MTSAENSNGGPVNEVIGVRVSEMTPAEEATQLTATVVVCTYNPDRSALQACLVALASQITSFSYQVLVVDDGSAETFVDLIDDLRVRFHRRDLNGGIGAARRTGVIKAEGTYVAFCDDDCVPDERWLEELVAAIRHTNAVGVAGRVVPLPARALTARYLANAGYGRPAPSRLTPDRNIRSRLVNYFDEMLRPTDLQDGDALAEVYTANAAFHRGAVLSVGNFDPELRSGEDVALSRKLTAGYPDQGLRYAEGATASLANDTGLGGLLQKTYRRYGDVLLVARGAGRIPPIFPLPITVLISGACARTLRFRLLGVAVSPLVAYFWWPIRPGLTVRERLLFPYVQFLVETAGLAGLLDKYFRRFLFSDIRRLTKRIRAATGVRPDKPLEIGGRR